MKTMPPMPYPVEVVLCTARVDWVAKMKALGISPRKEPMPRAVGSVSNFTKADGLHLSIVVITNNFCALPFHEKIGVIAHEAAHVWQHIEESICSTDSGHEIEAYSIQWIVQWLCEQLLAKGWLPS